ncbi:MAG: deoxyribodipyrimidine photo-lyase [Sulfurimonadaceae bacterium]|jgi:deoxyribodipyrimidine photo-lyase|nr:deoxyribodipyrimidine photo-lyase [Sulfurimonadaceae bacterium]
MKRVVWFRRDLRVEDNPLLGFPGEVLPIFIFDTHILNKLKPTDRRVGFIYDALLKLKTDLQQIGLDLKIFYGNPVEIFTHLVSFGFDEVIASGDYDSYAKERDKEVSHVIDFRYLQDTYIFRHDDVLKKDCTPYLVFTPFYKRALEVLKTKNLTNITQAKHSLYKADYTGITIFKDGVATSADLDIKNIGFNPPQENFLSPITKLHAIKEKLKSYAHDRDYPRIDATSNLAIDLRFGTIGVRQILRFIEGLEGSEPFLRQLIFRDFYSYLLFHFPTLEENNYKYNFAGIPDEEKFARFTSATTGVPIVDAGIRELLAYGTMHNRIRMVVASFFTKDLLLPWQWGESFFAEHLLDFDKASNVLSWQWSAGTGIDPQPYFRVFNPYLQSKKFDSEGIYIKKYIPELASVTSKYLHDEIYLLTHAIDGYPKPMVNHKIAAQKAISIFKTGQV